MSFANWIVEKLNPVQRVISDNNPYEQSTEKFHHYNYYYDTLEVVNRAVNMLVDDASEVNYKVYEKKELGLEAIRKGVKLAKVTKLLNHQPNPFQDINSFRRNCLMDLVLDGNIFIYFDGSHIYQIPANKVIIKTDKKNFIEGYEFDKGAQFFEFEEIIHIRDNNSDSLFRGSSRLKSALRTMALLEKMRKFQDNFFKNGAVPGLILTTPDTLSARIKDRMREEWKQNYRPESGGRNPAILDGGMKVDTINAGAFKELDFEKSTLLHESTVLKALGIPPIMLDSGNNANIRPNHRTYYLETIIPISKKIASAFQAYFGFKIEEDFANIPAVQPELRDQASYYQTLVNGGVMTANEARIGLGLPPDSDSESDKLRIPANIAGSAANPSEGGRPKE